MIRTEIYLEVERERERQDAEWGGPDHDRQHGSHNWIAFITKHLGKAVMWPFDKHNFRRQMIRVAALAIAAYEASDSWSD